VPFTVSIQTVGYLGAVLGVFMVVPQIVRTFRDRSIPGVSAMTWALTALSCLTWMLYGIRADEVPQIPGNVLMVSGAAVIVLAVPSTTPIGARAVRLAASAGVIIALATVLPPDAIGFLAFGIGLFSAVPQIVKSLTVRRSDVSAFSIPAWVLLGASQVCWLIYALVLEDIAVTISASFVLSSAALLVITELRRRPALASCVVGV
jgi:uncharacterized protein with PQ loop repeat